MINDVTEAVRASSPVLNNSIIKNVSVDTRERTVYVKVVTDKVFTAADKQSASVAVRKYVPAYFGLEVTLEKLSPDEEMVKRKIIEGISLNFKALEASLSNGDVIVKKSADGFEYTLFVLPSLASNIDICAKLNGYLRENFCGEFHGQCIASDKTAEDIAIGEKPDEIDFEIPARKFKIRDFGYLEGTKKQDTAVYLSDLNFAAAEVVVCGNIEDIHERTYTNKKGVEKSYFSFVLSDTTARVPITYFLRQKSADKIKKLKVGDSIVCTGSNEVYNGNLRYTAQIIDFGKIPENFVPEKRLSKPVPRFYHKVFPQPYTDLEQVDFFKKNYTPDCLLNNTFVVLDLETTGLNSSPVSGNMDRIIEIAAYKVERGEITQSFTTFVNPERKLSAEITALTGITEDMVRSAPTCEEVMPDFYKFCDGCILVGHNIVGFDYKFIEYYCAKAGYTLQRRLIDTIPLSQELLFLSNYKLNTVADKFNITFNHHRASDDALVTAKIFIELIKLKKSLPQSA